MLRRVYFAWTACQGRSIASDLAQRAQRRQAGTLSSSGDGQDKTVSDPGPSPPRRAGTLSSFVQETGTVAPSSNPREALSFGGGDDEDEDHAARQPASRLHHGAFSGGSESLPPSAARASRAKYAKAGYDFIEHIRVAGPQSALGSTQSALVLYTIVGTAVVLYCIYYFTTYSFLLTTDPAPQRNTMFQRFPSDYVVIVNKWTGHRRVVEVEPVPETERRPDGTMPYRDRVVHVNRLKDRLLVYQQRTHVTLVVDATDAVNPDRFVAEKDRKGRARVALRRTDQLLPDESADGGQPPPLPGRRHAPVEAAPARRRFLVEAEVRMRDIKNGGAQGNIVVFRETIAHVLTDKLSSRLYGKLLDRAMAGGTRPVYAEEMIRNGIVTAEGIALSQVVPDLAAFEEEVFAEVAKRLGDDVILYGHSVKLF